MSWYARCKIPRPNGTFPAVIRACSDILAIRAKAARSFSLTEHTMQKATLSLAVLVLALSGCAPKKIPGTDLDDTSETRAVIDVLQKYRLAVESKNTTAIQQLADSSFRDDGGSSSPDDDLDYASIPTRLAARMAKVSDLKLDVTVRRIEFDGDEKVARVTYSYQLSFKMPEYSTRTQSENDIKQMLLKRVGDSEWKITSGI
jgi:hypothetical protein